MVNKISDIYEINQIYHEDCTIALKNLYDNCIDLVVCSPPYDTLRTYDGFSWDFEETARQLFRVMKKGGVVVWVVNDATIDGSETGTSFKQALYFKECGFNLHDTMIFVKNQMPVPSSNRYYNCFEYMFVLSKNKPRVFNPIKDRENVWKKGNWKAINVRKKDGTVEKQKDADEITEIEDYGVRKNLWLYNVGFSHSTKDEIAKQHPAIFPEQLVEDHILSWSNENDVVLDPMCGSATTCKMAKLNKRNYIGFDISKKYIEIAKKRLDMHPTVDKWF